MSYHHKSHRNPQYTVLTPWETQTGQHYMDQLLTQQKSNLELTEIRKTQNLPLIAKKRANSQGSYLRKENIPSDSIRMLKSTHGNFHETFSRQFQTLSQQRAERGKPQRGPALQQINIKNLIIQANPSSQRKGLSRKRESSYILKQKFAEIRRSMKLVPANKQNLLRPYRYQA